MLKTLFILELSELHVFRNSLGVLLYCSHIIRMLDMRYYLKFLLRWNIIALYFIFFMSSTNLYIFTFETHMIRDSFGFCNRFGLLFLMCLLLRFFDHKMIIRILFGSNIFNINLNNTKFIFRLITLLSGIIFDCQSLFVFDLNIIFGLLFIISFLRLNNFLIFLIVLGWALFDTWLFNQTHDLPSASLSNLLIVVVLRPSTVSWL